MYNKLLLYTAVLRPILTYGSPVWGYAADSNIKTLEVAQNSIIRNIPRPLATFDPPIRIFSLRQAHPHKDSATISIWDGGMLRIPFPSDIQRHHIQRHDEGERILERTWLVSPR
ncbi:hypothetical protein TNCV_2717411 [Trichonephila clavipes]|nr:hypothetical protein TNCV_2717411 [Trichonephila clavipes]